MSQTVGVVGGGQLGRFFVLEAQALGYRTVVFDPDPLCPAAQVADEHVCKEFTDHDAVRTFCTMSDVATIEFENIPSESLQLIEKEIALRPSSQAVFISADRRREKQFISSIGLEVAPFEIIETADDLDRVTSKMMQAENTEQRFILKTATLGYDGRRQVPLTGIGDLAEAWLELQHVPCVLESFVEFTAEMSVIVARTQDGDISTFSPTENVHVNGILDHTVTVTDSEISREARRLGAVIANELEYVGVLGVEFFVGKRGFVVNEFAPRPHNSGHWTIDGAATSQFGQQVRALVGLSLGDTTQKFGAVAMANLLGDLWAKGEPNWPHAEKDSRVSLHLYGKHEPRAGRKMGHLTAVADDAETALRLVLEARQSILRR
jgi:5-(carboxyamino)imidazole ribonucleotide synthase